MPFLSAPGRSGRWIVAHQPWSVLGPLLVVQWLALLGSRSASDHNGWLFYQGGDQTFYWTSAHLLSHWTLPIARSATAGRTCSPRSRWSPASNILSGCRRSSCSTRSSCCRWRFCALYGIGDADRRAGLRLLGRRRSGSCPVRGDPDVRPALPREVRQHHAAAALGLTVLARLPVDGLPARHCVPDRPGARQRRLARRRPRRAGRRRS